MGWITAAGRAVREAFAWLGHAMAGPAAHTFDSTPRPIADVLADLNSLSGRRVSRELALSVPAVLRARNEACSVATLPLVLQRGLDRVDHPLFRQIDPDRPNVITLTNTIEDLIFEGEAWWQKTSLDFDNYPLSARWVPVWKVSVEPPKGETPPPGQWVYVEGKRVPANQMIRFESPNPGVLVACSRSIRKAVLLDQLAATYADNPRPLDYFTDTDDPNIEPFADDEIGPFLAKWKADVRRSSTAWMPSKVKRVDVNAPSLADLQLVELQKQATIEIANGLGVDAEDLGVSTTSRTYFNAQDRRISKINEGRRPIMRAITDRLSMGDITRRGYGVVFDLAEYLEADPTTQAGYWRALLDMGVTDAAEIRTWAKLPGRPPAAAPAPAPSPALGAGRPPIRLGDITPQDQLPRGRQFSDDRAGWTFAAAEFAAPPAAPAVDSAKRTISGLALPYNQIGRKYGIGYRFLPGSIEYDEHVKHFKDHMSPVGMMTRATDSPEGLSVDLSVLGGVDGSPQKLERDQLLFDAQEGLYNGLSVGVDFELTDVEGNPKDATWNDDDQVWDVHRATLREVSSTSMPVMTNARVTSVAASLTGGSPMHCQHCGGQHAPNIACSTYRSQVAAAQAARGFSDPPPPPAPPGPPGDPTPGTPTGPTPGPGHPPPPDGWAAHFNQLPLERQLALMQAAGQLPTVQNAVATQLAQTVNLPAFAMSAQVAEPAPYRIDRRGNLLKGTHDFSADLFAGWHVGGGDQAARDRAQEFVKQSFADGSAILSAAQSESERLRFAVTSGNVAALNPNRNRPDLFVDQMEYTYPLWEAIDKGSLQDITPFVVPKFNTATGLVANHTEGTEPTPGAVTATSQTITPSATSGKVEYTREAWEQGGNPQASGLIWRFMTRAYYEALEAAAAAFFAAQAASIADITITTAAVDAALDQSLAAGIIPLNYVRGGNRFRKAFTQIDLFKAMALAKDSGGRRLYPELGPQNAVGTTDAGYRAIRAHGVDWLPAWALAATGTVAASSWLFDPDGVAGWATPPQRIDIVWRVAWVDIGIWGYKATALLDANKAREVSYDPV